MCYLYELYLRDIPGGKKVGEVPEAVGKLICSPGLNYLRIFSNQLYLPVS